MDKPYWFKLIWYWVKVRERTGLTLPFIIGAKKRINPDCELDTIHELLLLIKNSDIDDVIILNYCPDIGEYVLGFDNKESPMDGTLFENETTQNKVFKVTLSTGNLGKSIVEISQSLDNKYNTYIFTEKYSKNNFNWHEFSENDIELINKAKDYQI